jgi:xanthine dehydrogenase accessory factor
MQITVVDEREEFADPSRFNDGVVVIEQDPRKILDDLPWGANCYHLIVTHDHGLDQDLVQSCLPRSVAWLGMIGSRAKVAKFFVRLRAAEVDETLFEKLSAPVGLDIGAETPHEIAVSILAEIVRVRRGASHSPVPLSAHPIQARGGDGCAHPPALTAELRTEET